MIHANLDENRTFFHARAHVAQNVKSDNFFKTQTLGPLFTLWTLDSEFWNKCEKIHNLLVIHANLDEIALFFMHELM